MKKNAPPVARLQWEQRPSVDNKLPYTEADITPYMLARLPALRVPARFAVRCYPRNYYFIVYVPGPGNALLTLKPMVAGHDFFVAQPDAVLDDFADACRPWLAGAKLEQNGAIVKNL